MTPEKNEKATTADAPSRVPDRKPDVPSAGPHDKPELTNPDATPGAGTLPDPGSSNPSDADASG